MKKARSRHNVWKSAPSGLKVILAPILRCIPQSLLLGRSFRRWLKLARASQTWTRAESDAYQRREIQRVCRLANAAAPFYQDHFARCGLNVDRDFSWGDFAKIPTIDKSVVRQHYQRMMTRPLDSPSIDYVSTGGSTGAPLCFFAGSARSAVEYAFLVAGWERIGYRLCDAQAVFRGQHVDPDAKGMRREYDPLLRRHYYSNFHMSENNMMDYMRHVATIGPCFLHVYPSSASALARCLRENSMQPPSNIRGILAGSEMVYPDDRAVAEAVFQRPYLSWYGHTEKTVLAVECERSSDYHVWSAYGRLEILDEQGRPITEPGGRGEIVGTGFVDGVTPFIRYRTGDFATYVADRCPHCRREQLLIRDIAGRGREGQLVALDGSRISLTAFNMHDDTFAAVLEYQFTQEQPGEALLRIVPARDWSTDMGIRLLKRVEAQLEHRLSLKLEVGGQVERSVRGKYARVVASSSFEAKS